MSQTIFVRPRHEYGSYSDLYQLIRLSGYPLIFADELDPQSDRCYIVTIYNDETQDGWPGASADIRLYDFEWHMDGLPPIPGVSQLWAADPHYARRLGARYVPFGSHPGLNLHPDWRAEPAYDVALLAYMGPPRRQDVANAMLAKGLRLTPNAWNPERDMLLRQTRLMAHVHQHDGIQTVAPQRAAIAAAYRLPLLTETLADKGVLQNVPILMSDKAHMADLAEMWLRDESASRLADFGEALYQCLCENHTFRTCVEAAL